MKRAKNTKAKVVTFASKLATELEGIVSDHVDDLLDRAHGYTVEKLKADIANGEIEVSEPKPGKLVVKAHVDRDEIGRASCRERV